MFVFYQPTNFYTHFKFKIKFNFILSVAEYPDCTYGHINVLLTNIIL
jgi:hypothetical protein